MSSDPPSTPTVYGDQDGRPVHALTVKIKGEMPLGRLVSEGDKVTIVATGIVGPPTFKRDKGLLVRLHTLDCDTVAEAHENLADEASAFLVRVADERAVEEARRKREAENDGQTSIDDALVDEGTDPEEPSDPFDDLDDG